MRTNPPALRALARCLAVEVRAMGRTPCLTPTHRSEQLSSTSDGAPMVSGPEYRPTSGAPG